MTREEITRDHTVRGGNLYQQPLWLVFGKGSYKQKERIKSEDWRKEVTRNGYSASISVGAASSSITRCQEKRLQSDLICRSVGCKFSCLALAGHKTKNRL